MMRSTMSPKMVAIYDQMTAEERAMADAIAQSQYPGDRGTLLDEVFATQFSQSHIAKWAWLAENWYR